MVNLIFFVFEKFINNLNKFNKAETYKLLKLFNLNFFAYSKFYNKS